MSKRILFISLLVLYSIVFFSYHLLYTWDSTEYLGMAMSLGTSAIKDVWLSHRPLLFPLLLRAFMIFGIHKNFMFKIMLYMFNILVLYSIYLISKKSTKINSRRLFLLVWVLITIVFNPFIYMYYHTVLTEFVAMSLVPIFVYILWNWVGFDADIKSKNIFYLFTLSLIICVAYHTKQSFIAMFLLTYFMGLILSIIRNHSKKNVLIKSITFTVSIIILFISIIGWSSYMKTLNITDVNLATQEQRVNGKLINGLNKLERLGNKDTLIFKDNSFTTTNGSILNINLNDSDIEEIKHVLDNTSKYKNFSIFQDRDDNTKQYLVLTTNNYSFNEQIKFLLHLIVKRPDIIINSYVEGYKRVTVTPPNMFENIVHFNYYYEMGENNLLNYNENYKYTMNDYLIVPKRNIMYKISDIFKMAYFSFNNICLILLPFLFISSIVLYILSYVKRFKYLIEQKANVELIILLFGISISCVMSYIIFGATIDRYLIPIYIPMFLGLGQYFLLVYNLIKKEV